ncbi:N-acetyltransferase family protein [Mesorhizobium sp. 10J20-29]
MHSVILRPVADTERERIVAIWHASASLPDVGPKIIPGKAEMRQWLDDGLASGWKVTVAAIGGEPVGFVAVLPETAVLKELFIAPGHLGKGLGKVLLAEAKSMMPAGFTLFTTSANKRARRFYEVEGLVALREVPHPRSGHPVTYYEWRGNPARGAVSQTGSGAAPRSRRG